MSEIVLDEVSVIDTPANGQRAMAAKSDGFYEKDDQGNELPIGGANNLNQLTDVDLTTTAPVRGDFLWYDGTKWIPQKTTASVFGCSATEANRDQFDSNSSSTFETYLTLNATQCEANKKYRIGVFAIWAMSSNSEDIEIDLTVQETGGTETTVGQLRQEAQDAGSDQKISSSGFFYYTPTTAGDLTIRMKYRPEGDDTAYMWYAGLEWWRVTL